MNLKRPIKGCSKEFGENGVRLQTMRNIDAEISMQYVIEATKA